MRVVYVAMKPQLRGRIRRNVVTLLELGADVTVLTVVSNKDFFVGLEHPRLRAEYLAARSLYVRFVEITSQRSRDAAERKRRRAAGEPAPEPVRSLPRWLDRLLFLLAGVLLLIARGIVSLRQVGASAAVAVGAAIDRIPKRIRLRWWKLRRWHKRSQRRLQRWWDREVAPRLDVAVSVLVRRDRDPRALAARSRTRWRRAEERRRLARRRKLLMSRAVERKRREAKRALINRRLATRRAFIQWGKDRLRPWHRTSRFFAFWKESAARAVALQPDLVVSSDLPGLVGAGRAARTLGIPHLHDCHELYLESASFRPLERRMLAPMERRYMRRADAVVAVNASIADEYGRRYGRRPVVVRNCASRVSDDLPTLDLRGLAGLSPTARVVLYQGGFSDGRGLEVCVAAVPDLPEDVHLVLLGYGPLRDPLLEWAAAAGVGHRVHVVDAVPPEELIQWTASADIGLMPYQPVSRNNLLALPNKIFEYTTVGLPIVVSDLPELRSIALDAGCGAVYDPFDPASLSRALRLVLADLDRYRQASTEYGRINVWENERLVLAGEMRRIAPRLADLGETSTAADLVTS